MQTLKLREAACWFLLFFLSIAAMSIANFATGRLELRLDYLLVLQIFASYFFADGRAVVIALLAGFTKDLLFGSLLGPSVLLGLAVVLLSLLYREFNGKTSFAWSLLYSVVLIMLYHSLKNLLFYILPVSPATFTLSERFARALPHVLRTIPASLLAHSLFFLLFQRFYPSFKQLNKENIDSYLDLDDRKAL